VTEVLQLVARIACGIFTGAAVYSTLAEHPARMKCGTPKALQRS